MTPRERYAKRMAEIFDKKFPFVCSECAMPFNSGLKLARHMHQIHEDKPKHSFTEGDKEWLKSIRIDPES